MNENDSDQQSIGDIDRPLINTLDLVTLGRQYVKNIDVCVKNNDAIINELHQYLRGLARSDC